MVARLQIHVQPRARRNEIVGWHGGRLRVRLTAPPVDGAANVALVRLLAKALGVHHSTITITHGLKSRDKAVEIEDLDPDELTRRLEALI